MRHRSPRFHPVAGCDVMPQADGSLCAFTRSMISWCLGCGRDDLAFADEWLNDEELIEFVTIDGKIVGACDRTLTAAEVEAHARKQWKGQK